MYKNLLTVILLLTGMSLSAQVDDPWYAFWNRDTTLIGFKDKSGQVKIEPKFTGLTSAGKFDHIIAVTEELDGVYRSYYLSKSGKASGMDSLYVFDNAPDCESEGFIRFRDHKTDKAGMLNRMGEVVIPAGYDDLTGVRNGLVAALRDAEKKQLDDEHFSWVGGREVLIDTTNRVLVGDFRYDGNLDFYSLKISDRPDEDAVRQNFAGSDGKYYSFIDFEKEFVLWLQSSLLNNLSRHNLRKSANKEIYCWKEPDGWTAEPKKVFIRRNFKLVRSRLLELKSTGCEYSIFTEGLNPFIYFSDDYLSYFNNCGEPKEWIHPVKNVVITHQDKEESSQDHFDFLRTADGYKLISANLSGIRD